MRTPTKWIRVLATGMVLARADEVPDLLPTTWLSALLPSERPRERLMALGSEPLHDAELYALVLGSGGKRADALATGMIVAHRFPELRRLAAAGIHELAEIPGVGLAKACRLKAALALASRLDHRALQRGEPLGDPEAVSRRIGAPLRGLEREVFVAIAVDVKHRVIGSRRIAEGGVTAVSLEARDVFMWLVREGASGMILVHNHPSGDPTPSLDDEHLTRRLGDAGQLLGIDLLDHLVVAQGGFYSFAAHGQVGNETTISGHRRSRR
jgi:DNA repair protein RadC